MPHVLTVESMNIAAVRQIFSVAVMMVSLEWTAIVKVYTMYMWSNKTSVTCTYIHVRMYMYVYIHTYIHVRMYMYVYIQI